MDSNSTIDYITNNQSSSITQSADPSQLSAIQVSPQQSINASTMNISDGIPRNNNITINSIISHDDNRVLNPYSIMQTQPTPQRFYDLQGREIFLSSQQV